MTPAFARSWPASRLARHAVILSFDALATAVAFLAAILARFEGNVPSQWHRPFLLALPLLVGIRVLAILAARLHCWSFSMSGLPEALRLASAMLAGSLACLLTCTALLDCALPRAVWALEFFFATTLVAALRFGPRVASSWRAEYLRSRAGAARTIIVGTDGPAEMLARDLRRCPDSPYDLIGFVDERQFTSGMHIAGRPVLGAMPELPALIRRHGVTMVLLAISHLSAKTVREILDMCDRLRARFKVIPSSFPYLDERISAAMLHDLSPEDLLSRDAVRFDEAEIGARVQGRSALVTGAGGTIGGEVCRQLARYGASQLIMADLNENELYLGSRQLAEQWPCLDIHVEVVDIREPGSLLRLGQRHRPHYVLHAAAHKHVPLMEGAPEEAVKNNVFGTLHVARMAIDCGAERFVLISTDKAVNPTSVMGASKRIAELLVTDLARSSKTRMTAVRFGNVLGSAGSVVPLFKQQIARGGPVTVTHPECTRYFMTIPEAVGLVLLAGLGDYGQLCVLEMGEPIRIADLAKHLITMSGRLPETEIAIVYTGMRPGEKLHEELLTEQEEQTLTVRNRIRVARSPVPPRDFSARLAELRLLADNGDREGVLRALHALVPSYRRTQAAGQGAARAANVASLDRVSRAGDPGVAAVARSS
jgi:FlaA1/EpsC-like NDP-sugar epimerase